MLLLVLFAVQLASGYAGYCECGKIFSGGNGVISLVMNIQSDDSCVCCDLSSANLTSANVEAKVNETCPDNTNFINLSRNPAFTIVPPGLLSNFSALLVAFFQHCGLTTLPAGMFKNNPELRIMRASYNDITQLPLELFQNTTKLADLGLGGNCFSELPRGFLANVNQLNTHWWSSCNVCSQSSDPASCEERTTVPNDFQAQSPTLYYKVPPPPTPEPTSEPTAFMEHGQVICLKKRAKVKCPKGEFFKLEYAFFGRSDVADTTCKANYKDYPDHTCAANEHLLTSNLQEMCNGKRKCKLKNRKKQRDRYGESYGLHESCNPFLEVRYNCVRNAGTVQKKKQVKEARKQAKRTGDWDAFFDMLSPAAA